MSTPGAFQQFEQAGWERAAAAYADCFGELTLQSIAPLLDAVGAAPGLRLLDIACGPAYAAAQAARCGCSATGVDFSPAMVEVARAMNPGLNVVEGDACNLNFPDSSFDAAVMNFGMLHLEAPDRAIDEAFRVLRPEGRFAFTVWDIPERAVGFGIILTAIQAHGKSDIPLPPGPPFFRFGDAQESRRTLEAAGFEKVEVRQVPLVWHLARPEDLFTAFLTAGVRTTALLCAQTSDAQERIRRETVKQVETFRAGSGIAIPTPCVLTSAQRPRQIK